MTAVAVLLTGGSLALVSSAVSQAGTCSGLISTNPYPPVAGEQVNVCSQPLPGAPVTAFNWDIDGRPGVDVSTTEPGVPWTFAAPGDAPLSVEVIRADGTRAHYRFASGGGSAAIAQQLRARLRCTTL